jgi:proline iminopeptidase
VQSGFLAVDPPHEIHYQVHGNPAGKPVFVLHGGPGVGCYPRLAQYFDPAQYMIVLHDQRGAGRSRPAGHLEGNTTQALVEDIERLRRHLGIEGRIFVFGGSWGSTLALAYAETHPERVQGMVLRGIFTARAAETKHVFGDGAAQLFFPEAVARLHDALPPGTQFTPASLLRLFTTGSDRDTRAAATAWIRYAIKTGQLHASDEDVESGWGDFDARPGARIDCHYAAHGYFLEEGQLLRNAERLKDIPVTIINGRYDVVCPPVTAWELHQRLPKSRLVITEQAGHSESEATTTAALLAAVAERFK